MKLTNLEFLKKHKGYLIGYESDAIMDGGFGSTDG